MDTSREILKRSLPRDRILACYYLTITRVYGSEAVLVSFLGLCASMDLDHRR
jgi:hypothetical protein